MKPELLNERLSRISTMWTMLRQAHEGSEQAAVAAQELLVQRYRGAVYRYLIRILDDTHAADDLTQEFSLALLRGEFRQADPQRGRFRSYVKSVLFHLIGKYRKQQKKQPRGAGGLEMDEMAAPAEDIGPEFNEDWRAELLARTWRALEQVHPTFHTVLRFRADNPKLSSAEMAERLGGKLDKPLTDDGVRQTLRRAREQFADLLLDEVAGSLETPTAGSVEEEVRELNLLDYCRPALERYGCGKQRP